MRHIKTIKEFKSLNEQLFGSTTNQILDLLGIGNEEIKELGNSPVSGSVTGGASISTDKKANINALLEAMKRHGITNPYTQIAILGVIGKECNFIPKGEYMDYSKERLPEVWGVFSKTGKKVSKGEGKNSYNDLAVKYANNPEKLANFVYGQKPNGMRENAYGNTQPGDGWKYRGRGFNQITFKGTYQNMQKLYDKSGKLKKPVDIVNNPDQLNDIDVAAEFAILFFLSRSTSPIMARKFGVSDINGFKDQATALKAMTNANAGWGNDVTGTESLERAQKYAASFRIDPSGRAEGIA